MQLNLKSYVVLILIAVSGITWNVSHVLSQTDEPIYSGSPAINIWWSQDSKELVFQDGLVPGMRGSQWYSYSIETEMLDTKVDWPLFDRISEDQMSFINSFVGENGLVFISPDERYIVHNRVNPGQISDLMLSDMVTRITIPLNIEARSITRGTDHFNVRWSEDSNSFAVRTACTSCTFSDGRYFVDSYSDDITAVRVRDITNITDSITGNLYFTSVLYDVSPDGSNIVTSSLTTRDTGEERALVIWEMGDNFVAYEIPTLQNQSVNDAIFLPEDDGKLLLTASDQVVLYDIVNNSEQIIPSSINLSSSDSVDISPNGDWLAISRVSSPFEMELFVAQVQSLAVESLRLTSLCSPDPDSIRIWRVRNTNPDQVDFTWDVVGTDQTGSGTVPGGSADAPGEITFETVAVDGPNTTRIFVNGEQQDVKDSGGAPCDPDIPYPVQPLSVCWVDNPNDNSSAWEVTNPNPVPLQSGPEVKVLYDWEVSDSSGVIQSGQRAETGGTTRYNTPLGEQFDIRWYLLENGQTGPVIGQASAQAIEADRCPS